MRLPRGNGSLDHHTFQNLNTIVITADGLILLRSGWLAGVEHTIVARFSFPSFYYNPPVDLNIFWTRAHKDQQSWCTYGKVTVQTLGPVKNEKNPMYVYIVYSF